MASTIITKYGSGAPLASDLVRGELAVDTELGRLYTETSGGAVVEIGLNPGGNLDVTGTVTADGLTVDLADNAGVLLQSPNDSSTSFLKFGDSTSNDSGSVSYDHFSDAMRFKTVNTERLRIASNGNISFYEDTGTTAKFFWDASAESLGIGTASPSSVLSVKSDVNNNVNNGILFEAADSTNKLLQLYENSVGECYMGFYQADVQTALIRTNGNSYFNGGNVGIGTASPAELLHIESGTNGEQVDIRFRGLTTSAGAGRSANIGFDPDPNDTGTSSEAQLYLSADTTNKTLVATASGNVGIGVTPSNLSANRTFEIGSSTIRTGNGLTQAEAASFIQLNSNVKYDALGTSLYASTVPAAKYVQYNGEHIWSYAASGTAGNTITWSEAMRIDSSGNVGIGTDSPDALLDLEDTEPTIRLTDDRNISWAVTETLGKIEFYSSDSSGIGPHVTGFIKNLNAHSSGPSQVAGALSFGVAAYDTAAAEAMRIDSSGNVGIGTSSPTGGKLHVVGDVFAQSGSFYVGVGGVVASDSTSRDLNFAIGNTTPKMTLDTSGNLLVGTTDTTPWDNSTATSADDGIFLGGGRLGLAKWGGVPLLVNRTDSDGDIAIFYKDGSPVGSIGTTSGGIYLGSPSGAGKYFANNGNFSPSTNGDRNLGDNSLRWQDLYLSGGVNQSTVLVSALPAAASSTGYRFMVSDSTVAASGNFGATVAGSGSNVVPVFSDGTNWLIG